MARLACLTIDLDGLRHYAGLYGLPLEALGPGGTDAVARLAADRLCELLAGVGRGLPGTFFAIGEDLIERREVQDSSHSPHSNDEDEIGPLSLLAGAAPLQRAAQAGHEIGNHTRHHRYDLARLSPERIAREVHGGAKAIAAVVGRRPVGFRAPGYTLSAPVLAAVVEAGHSYDSSTYPAVPYYLAKASVMGWQRLRGRGSRAILDRPRVLTAPPLPYRPAQDEPYAAGDLPLWELPITTEPWTRLPLIGPTVTTVPTRVFDLAYLGFRRREFLNLELHGIDLMDASDGAGEALPRYQRDLTVPTSRKLERLRHLFARIADDYEVVPLATVAERLQRDGVV